jgi:urease accessory protein
MFASPEPHPLPRAPEGAVPAGAAARPGAGRAAPAGPAPAVQPRAEGLARIGVVRGAGGRSRIARLGAGGSARCLVPRLPGGRIEAVLINSAGGLAGGDRFVWEAEAGADAALTVTTQAAERVYRSADGAPARVEARLALGPGARLDWLPQETILFDAGALERRLEAEMAEDARLTAVEPLVLGRAAMGETVRRAALADHRRIRRGGRLVFADCLRLEGAAEAVARGPATWGGNRAGAGLLHLAPDAETRLEPVRAALAALPEVEAGASAWDGILAARLLAPGGLALRRAVAAALACLRADPMPRPWTM